MPRSELPAEQIVQAGDEQRGYDGKQGDFMGLQLAEAGHVGEVHEAELDGAGGKKSQPGFPRQAADERQENEGAEGETHSRQPGGGQAGKTVADQAERKGPDQRHDDEQNHDLRVW